MKKTITLIIAVIVVTVIMSFSVLDASGKIGKTNSPDETTCNDAGCHEGNSLNVSGGSITITAPTLTNWQYTPGQIYTISVTVARLGLTIFGFDFEALTSLGANGGTITVTDSTQTQTYDILINGNLRKNITHISYGGSGTTNIHTFIFNWTAPSSNIGNVTFYAAGNAANGDWDETGDYIYTTSQVVTPASSIGIIENTISTINLTVYPNPVVESANISYQLTENATVSVRLISLRGKTVTTFFKEMQTTGIQNKQLVIDPSIAKGIYLIALDVKGNHTYKKIIIE